jgi:hypothetical protein
MQIGSAFALNILSNTNSSGTTRSSKSSAQLTILQNSTRALDTLRQHVTSSSDAAKERAARKLEEAKQQLQMLKSGGLPPETIVRLAAELAHKVSAAAAEFAAAVASSAGAAAVSAGASAGLATAGTSPASAADASASATTDAGESADASASAQDTETSTTTDEAEAGGDTEQTEDADDATQARNAYSSVVEDGKQASSGISSEDRKTMEEFKSVLRDIKQLLDKAMREIRTKGAGHGANNSEMMGSAALDAQLPSATPTSIIV